jgi:predicted 3-demethylubiquinone-9 3-methyltransferase (glyoxalase superfamily)
MQPRVQPFLMFQGSAEEAMRFYASLFPDGYVTAIRRYGPGEAGAEGSACPPVNHESSMTPRKFFLFDASRTFCWMRLRTCWALRSPSREANA